MKSLNDLSLGDLHMISKLPAFSSLRSLSKFFNKPPHHLSKSIQKLEVILGIVLIQRSKSGIIITDEGKKLAKMSFEFLAFFYENLESIKPSHSSHFKKYLNFATDHLFHGILCTHLFGCFQKNYAEIGLNCIEFSPENIFDFCSGGKVDAVFSYQKLTLGKSWEAEHIGDVGWGYHVRSMHPLVHEALVDDQMLCRFPFVRLAVPHATPEIFTESLRDNLVTGIYGFQSSTLEGALRILLQSDHILYLPNPVADEFVKEGKLKRLIVDEIYCQRTSLYLYAHVDRVHKPMLENIKTLLRFIFEEQQQQKITHQPIAVIESKHDTGDSVQLKNQVAIQFVQNAAR